MAILNKVSTFEFWFETYFPKKDITPEFWLLSNAPIA